MLQHNLHPKNRREQSPTFDSDNTNDDNSNNRRNSSRNSRNNSNSNESNRNNSNRNSNNINSNDNDNEGLIGNPMGYSRELAGNLILTTSSGSTQMHNCAIRILTNNVQS